MWWQIIVGISLEFRFNILFRSDRVKTNLYPGVSVRV